MSNIGLSVIGLILFLNCSSQQITYQDSCLRIELYSDVFKNGTDTVFKIRLKNYDLMHDSSLNLNLAFRNTCESVLLVESEFNMIDFHFEGQKLVEENFEKFNPIIAFDYFHGVKRRERIILPYAMFLTAIKYPIGLDIKKPGTYRFRVVYRNQSNYIPVQDFKKYYSNWCYLHVVE